MLLKFQIAQPNLCWAGLISTTHGSAFRRHKKMLPLLHHSESNSACRLTDDQFWNLSDFPQLKMSCIELFGDTFFFLPVKQTNLDSFFVETIFGPDTADFSDGWVGLLGGNATRWSPTPIASPCGTYKKSIDTHFIYCDKPRSVKWQNMSPSSRHVPCCRKRISGRGSWTFLLR